MNAAFETIRFVESHVFDVLNSVSPNNLPWAGATRRAQARKRSDNCKCAHSYTPRPQIRILCDQYSPSNPRCGRCAKVLILPRYSRIVQPWLLPAPRGFGCNAHTGTEGGAVNKESARDGALACAQIKLDDFKKMAKVVGIDSDEVVKSMFEASTPPASTHTQHTKQTVSCLSVGAAENRALVPAAAGARIESRAWIRSCDRLDPAIDSIPRLIISESQDQIPVPFGPRPQLRSGSPTSNDGQRSRTTGPSPRYSGPRRRAHTPAPSRFKLARTGPDRPGPAIPTRLLHAAGPPPVGERRRAVQLLSNHTHTYAHTHTYTHTHTHTAGAGHG